MQIIKKIFLVEAYLINFIQIILGHPIKYKKIIKLTKIFTSLKYQKFILIILLFILPINKSTKLIIFYYYSRKFILIIKNKFKLRRPFVRFPFIKYYGKRKDKSYSFPSTGILSITIIYGNLINFFNFNNYSLYLLIFLVGFSRIFRGIHYFHDILISYLLGNLINYLFLRF